MANSTINKQYCVRRFIMYRPAGYYDSEEDEFDEFGYILDYIPSSKKKNYCRTAEQQTPTEDYDALLYSAVMHGDLKEVQRVLQLADNLRSGACLRQGWPVLLYACYEANLEIVQYLVEEVGLDVQRSYNLETALMIACSSPKPTELVYAVVRLLLDHGANVGVLNRYGCSPLMFACKEGHLEVVKEIVGESSLLSVDNDGNTALFHAVKNNRYEIVKVLLRAGAATNIENREGYTPKQCALMCNYNNIAELLPDEEDFYELPSKYTNYTNYRNFIHGEQEQNPPDYFPELMMLLFGMESEHNIRFFAQANINLFDLLTVTDDRLREIGIKYPIERKRILLGLYDFHRQAWSNSSLWTIPTSEPLDCYHVQISLVNMLRQLTVMHASLLYTVRLTRGTDPEVFADVMQKSQLLCKLNDLRSLVEKFKGQMSEIQRLSPRKPVLHVSKQETKRRSSHKAITVGACLLVGSLAIYLKFKK